MRWVARSSTLSNQRKTNMPLIITDASKLTVKNQSSVNVTREENNKARSQITDRIVPNEGTKLYVNGKERKIGKKSQYLLDMLTLDD